MRFQRWVTFSLAVAALAPSVPCRAQQQHAVPGPTTGSKYLLAWTGDGARKVSDFLAVIDADPGSTTYGHVVASVPAGAVGTMPHHTEYVFPANGMLLANGWAASRTFLFDVRHPATPKLVTSFGAVGPYAFPHAFVRLANGHVLGTFQGKGTAYAPPGGLVELDERGHLIRSASAAGLGLADTLAWPYSLAVDARHDRVVTTNTTMPIPRWLHAPTGSWRKDRADSVITSQIEIWRLSDLKLLHVITVLPPSHAVVTGGYTPNELSAEPRLLPDGSMYVNTFACGLYHLTGLDTPTPRAALVHVFPAARDVFCAVPAVVGHYWVQTVPALPGLIALDITNPAHPVEVSRLTLPRQFGMPHWLASDTRASRVVVTGDDMGYVRARDRPQLPRRAHGRRRRHARRTDVAARRREDGARARNAVRAWVTERAAAPV